MNTHRLNRADFDDVMTEPAVHDAADTQWPAFTAPMRFDADWPATRTPPWRTADFWIVVIGAVAAALALAGVI